LKQKLTILAMIVLATIFIATPVLAAGSSRTVEVAKRTPTIISMTATILYDDVDDKTNEGKFTVKIRMTNRAFIQYRGEIEDVLIDEDTKCVEWLRYKKSQKIDCSLLDEDDSVSINAKLNLVTGKFTARRVTISQPRIPQ